MERHKMKWGKNDGVLALLGVVPIVAWLALYSQLPDQVAVHFGLDNTPNNYQSKLSAMLLFTLLSLGVPILMKLLRRIDPKRANYEKFEGAFEITRFGIGLLMSCISVIALLFNLGYHVNMSLIVLLSTGVLFLVIGNYLGQVRFNYFYGIRTPWTLASEEVWRRTHRMCGPVYMGVGAWLLIGTLLPHAWLVSVFLLGLAVAIIVPLWYSYATYKKVSGQK